MPKLSASENTAAIKCCGGLCVIGTLVGIIIGIYAAAAGQVWLLEDEQALMVGALEKYVLNGPGVQRFDPFWYSAEIRKGVLLNAYQYVLVTDTLSGLVTVEQGPKLFFPGAWDSTSEPKLMIQIQKNEYVKLIDSVTGAVRVLSGEQRAVPGPYETVLGSVTAAVNVDEDTAPLVLSTETGQQRLVRERGLFIPGPYDEVIESRSLIYCEPHEVVVTRDVEGTYTFHGGNETGGGDGASFFLEPYSERVTMEWTSDRGIGETVMVDKIDTRARYSFFDFVVRTSDNVELMLEGITFWQIFDVDKMIRTTADPQGDVWYHSRSSLNAAVSAVDFDTFMDSFNSLVSNSDLDQEFYSERGIRLHSLEVTQYACKDPAQEQVLQEIIQETTNRINALQKQKSVTDVEAEKLQAELALELARTEYVTAQANNAKVQAVAEQELTNEVQKLNMTAQIELETSRTALVTQRATNDKLEAQAEGEAEGLRYAHSLSSYDSALGEVVSSSDARMELYKFLSQQEATTEQLADTTRNLGTGNAHLYLTPESLNLNLQQVAVSSAGSSSVLPFTGSGAPPN